MLLDPGTVPKRWHALVASSPGLRDRFRICRKSHLFKPPRSHYDSLTNVSVWVHDVFVTDVFGSHYDYLINVSIHVALCSFDEFQCSGRTMTI